MTATSFLRSFIFILVLVFVVTAAVSYLYSLVVHGSGQADWGSAVRLGIILGIILPFVRKFEGKK
jgi:hypothetical protein